MVPVHRIEAGHPRGRLIIDGGRVVAPVLSGAEAQSDPSISRSFRRLWGHYWCALRYAAITDAGTLPRSLTFSPLCRAHERTSALLGAPADPTGVGVRDRPEPVSAAPARLRGFVPTDPFFGFVVRLRGGLISFRPSSETTSVTPYRAPTTRSASSRGSLESTVSFKAVPFRWPPSSHNAPASRSYGTSNQPPPPTNP